ncbi:MAG: hypothetical protein AAFZ07_25725 [Actinomycetota bacterium]
MGQNDNDLQAKAEELASMALRLAEQLYVAIPSSRIAQSTKDLLLADADRLANAARGLLGETGRKFDRGWARHWWELIKRAAGGIALVGGAAAGGDLILSATLELADPIIELVSEIEAQDLDDVVPVDEESKVVEGRAAAVVGLRGTATGEAIVSGELTVDPGDDQADRGLHLEPTLHPPTVTQDPPPIAGRQAIVDVVGDEATVGEEISIDATPTPDTVRASTTIGTPRIVAESEDDPSES